MKLLCILSLVALASSANVKRQIFFTQPIIPVHQVPIQVPQSPLVAVLREQIHHVPFVVNQEENKEHTQVVEQQLDSSSLDAPATSVRSSTETPIAQENQPIVQENQSVDTTSTDLEHNTTHTTQEQVPIVNNESSDVSSPMNSGHSQSGFSYLRDSLLDSLPNHGNQQNLPVMIPLNPNFQAPNFQSPNFQGPNFQPQNPIFGQMVPNMGHNFYNPNVHSLTPNFIPHSSYVLPTPHYNPIFSTAQYLVPIHLPKPAQRQFNFPITTTTTTIAPEVSVKDTLSTKGGSLRSGVKGGNIGTRSGTKNHFTPTDAPVIQQSI